MINMLSSILLLSMQLAVPIVLGALAGTIAERSGIILLGVEGLMLFGAFAGVYGVYLTGSPWFGVFFSLFVGAFVGLVYALFAIKFRSQQAVVGVGFNLLASGLTGVLLKIVWSAEGMSASVASVPKVTVPLLNKIPFIGKVFENQTPYLFMMFAIVFITWVVFYKTKIGLRIRAMGENPQAVQTAGVKVNKYRYIALSISGAIAALGGSFLSISHNNLFVTDMVAGRGFMGLAANIFGGWHPVGSLLASFVFSTAQAVRFILVDYNIPTHLISLLPYVTTLIVLLVIGLRSKSQNAPEGLGELVD